jgi:hypothetical protein
MVNLDEPTVISVAAAVHYSRLPMLEAATASFAAPSPTGCIGRLCWPNAIDLRLFRLWAILRALAAGLLLVRIARRARDLFGLGFALLPYAAIVIMQSLHKWAMKGDAWLLPFFQHLTRERSHAAKLCRCNAVRSHHRRAQIALITAFGAFLFLCARDHFASNNARNGVWGKNLTSTHQP